MVVRRNCTSLYRSGLVTDYIPQETSLVFAKIATPRRLSSLLTAVLLSLTSALTACAGRPAKSSQQPAGSGAPAAVISQLHPQVRRWLAEYQLAAGGGAVMEVGRVTVANVYGQQGPGDPASNATLFNLASLT